jgi:hypothetical protein
VTSDVATAAAVNDDELFCPECGYNLRGIDNIDRCPECGQVLDRARLTASNIPWTHRDEIGSVKAYRRTVWLALRYPFRAADDVARPVSFDDAKQFRLITVRLAWLSLVALLMWGCIEVARDRPITMSSTASPVVRIGWALEILAAPVIAAALYAFLLAASGAASYFFHPRWLPVERQNRAVALSYYACAPMALTPISVASIIGAFFIRENFGGQPAILIGIALTTCALVPAIQAVMSVATPLLIMRRATHCGIGRAIALVVALPVLWALLGVVILVGIPAAYLFVALVIMSLIA